MHCQTRVSPLSSLCTLPTTHRVSIDPGARKLQGHIASATCRNCNTYDEVVAHNCGAADLDAEAQPRLPRQGTKQDKLVARKNTVINDERGRGASGAREGGCLRHIDLNASHVDAPAAAHSSAAVERGRRQDM